MVLTEEDEIINAKAALDFFNTHADEDSFCHIYTSSTQGSQTSLSNKVVYQHVHDKKNRILGFSHVCLATPPEHRHYGSTPDYVSRVHHSSVIGKNPRSGCLNTKSNPYLGPLTPENLKSYAMRRLTFNPHFNEIMLKMNQFLS